MVIAACLRSFYYNSTFVSHLFESASYCGTRLTHSIMSARLRIDRAVGPTMQRTTCRRIVLSIASAQRQRPGAAPRRDMATVVPPATQDATSSKGPTAMVFMNMGGPSTTDEVGIFLSRLFVGFPIWLTLHSSPIDMIPSGRWGSHTSWCSTVVSRTSHFSTPYAKDSEAVCCNWWRISNSKMVGIPSKRDVQDLGSSIARNSTTFAICCLSIRGPVD